MVAALHKYCLGMLSSALHKYCLGMAAALLMYCINALKLVPPWLAVAPGGYCLVNLVSGSGTVVLPGIAFYLKGLFA